MFDECTDYGSYTNPSSLRLQIFKSSGLVLPTFLYGLENWTLTALQRRRIEAAEINLLRPLAGYTLCDQKTNDSVRRKLQT